MERRKPNYGLVPRVSREVAEALAKSIDRSFNSGTPRDTFYDCQMRILEERNPEIIGFVKDRCAEFGQNNPELDPDYIDGYFQGAREAMLGIMRLLYSQIEDNDLRESLKDIDKWKIS